MSFVPNPHRHLWTFSTIDLAQDPSESSPSRVPSSSTGTVISFSSSDGTSQPFFVVPDEENAMDVIDSVVHYRSLILGTGHTDGDPTECLVRDTVRDFQTTLLHNGYPNALVYSQEQVAFKDRLGSDWLFYPIKLKQPTDLPCRTCNRPHTDILTRQTGGLVSAEDPYAEPINGDLYYITPQVDGAKSTVLTFLPDTSRGPPDDPLGIKRDLARDTSRDCDVFKIRRALIAQNAARWPKSLSSIVARAV